MSAEKEMPKYRRGNYPGDFFAPHDGTALFWHRWFSEPGCRPFSGTLNAGTNINVFLIIINALLINNSSENTAERLLKHFPPKPNMR